jgi:hypothetical protein
MLHDDELQPACVQVCLLDSRKIDWGVFTEALTDGPLHSEAVFQITQIRAAAVNPRQHTVVVAFSFPVPFCLPATCHIAWPEGMQSA